MTEKNKDIYIWDAPGFKLVFGLASTVILGICSIVGYYAFRKGPLPPGGDTSLNTPGIALTSPLPFNTATPTEGILVQSVDCKTLEGLWPDHRTFTINGTPFDPMAEVCARPVESTPTP